MDVALPPEPVSCKNTGCDETIKNASLATEAGWYLDKWGFWHCYKHSPKRERA